MRLRGGGPTRYLVEVVLDTGQRYQSVDIKSRGEAESEASELRSRVRVVAVTIIDLETGEATTKPSRNLAANVSVVQMNHLVERELLAEAFGGG